MLILYFYRVRSKSHMTYSGLGGLRLSVPGSPKSSTTTYHPKKKTINHFTGATILITVHVVGRPSTVFPFLFFFFKDMAWRLESPFMANCPLQVHFPDRNC